MTDPLPTELQLNGPQVDAFHTASDVDSGRFALHHTLGSAPNQAAPGDHTHPAYQAYIDNANTAILAAQNAYQQAVNPNTARAYSSSAIPSMSSGTLTAIQLNATYWNRGMTLGSNVLTVGQAGFYLCEYQVAYPPNGTGTRRASIYLNGTEESKSIEQLNASSTGDSTIINGTYIVRCANSTDTIGLGGYQTSGVGLVPDLNYTHLAVCWIGNIV